MITQEFNRSSSVEYVEMGFDVPVKQLLTEYELIKDRLVVHRPDDGHKDWCAVTLYGFDSDKTNSHWEYDRRKQRPRVTDVGERCPRTIEWVKSLPYARIDDIRFLVIKPKGFITKHVDVPDRNWLEPLNICLSYPRGNRFVLNNKEVKYVPGMPLVLNIHYEHYVENNSDKERVHLLVHGKKKKEFWDHVETFRQP